MVAVEAAGAVAGVSEWDGDLYRAYQPAAETTTPVRLYAAPYYAWANRGAGAMRVWIPCRSLRICPQPTESI